MNKLKYILATFFIAGFMVSCEKDDFTGDSQLTPSNPTITITAPATQDATETGSVYEYTVTLSEPQIVDVAIHITKVSGDATEGEDFVINNSGGRLVIPAYRTSGTVSVTVLADVITEEDETFTLQIGDDRTANATITPKNVEFTIQNVTADDLVTALSWDAEFYDAEGEEMDGDDIADLIFYLTDEDGDVIETIDEDAFEAFVLTGADYADGTYYVKVGISGVVEPGDLGTYPVLDIMFDFDQVGKIDHTTFTFEGVFNTQYQCDENQFTVASIVKTGNDYVVTEIGEQDPIPPILAGSYTSTLNPVAGPYWFGIGPQSRTVTVTQTAVNRYAVSDITSGAYNACCGLQLNQAAVIAVTPCWEVYIVSETGTDVSGQSAKSLGTFNPATNTFTIWWRDRYGSDGDTDPGADLYSTLVKQ